MPTLSWQGIPVIAVTEFGVINGEFKVVAVLDGYFEVVDDLSMFRVEFARADTRQFQPL